MHAEQPRPRALGPAIAVRANANIFSRELFHMCVAVVVVGALLVDSTASGLA